MLFTFVYKIMRTGILHTDEIMNDQQAMFATALSFNPYIKNLRSKVVKSDGIHSTLFRFIIRQFEREPELMQDKVQAISLEKYEHLFKIIGDSILPLLNDESENLYSLSYPISSKTFFCTDAFYNAVFDEEGDFIPIKTLPYEYLFAYRCMQAYRLVLQRFYNYSFGEPKLVHGIENPVTGLKRYYKLNMDARFVEIGLHGTLPEPDIAFFAQLNNEEKALQLLQKEIPLSLFSFNGFSIVKLEDVTASYIPELIKNIIISEISTAEDIKDCIADISLAITELLGYKSIRSGLVPFYKVNNKYVLDDYDFSGCVMLQLAKSQGSTVKVYNKLVETFTNRPQPLFFSSNKNITEESLQYLHPLLKASDNSFIFIPLQLNTQLVGLLEVSCVEKEVLHERMITWLEPVIPLLSQLANHRVEAFENKIQSIIKEKFTSLQSSVEWKFNQVAWHYLRKKSTDKKENLESIFFENVHPLYGAVDIKQSSLERNFALQKDMQSHFKDVVGLLNQIKGIVDVSLVDEKIYQCNHWLALTDEHISTDQEVLLSEFIEKDLYDFLIYIRDNFPEVSSLVTKYFKMLGDSRIVFTNRQQFEESMQLINGEVSNYLDKEREALQKIYPNYFEKLRSDGIEYDIYIGQSISPEKPFNFFHLKNLRLWQVKSMCHITRLTYKLLQTMQKPLLTTQLIFVHSNTIDISFRVDERRFDVEGSYNIRYEIIKKRIDKVHIKETGERLTKPGTVAIVYSNHKDAEEYLTYIDFLKNEALISGETEMLQLEELQGVSGLKALRLTVKYD